MMRTCRLPQPPPQAQLQATPSSSMRQTPLLTLSSMYETAADSVYCLCCQQHKRVRCTLGRSCFAQTAQVGNALAQVHLLVRRHA